MNPARTPRSLLLFAILASTLAACGKGDDEKRPTQIAARVNGDEISVHQINDVLARARGVTADNAEAAKRGVLGKLVDRQLAVQQAIELKLHRTPAVVAAIESARNEVLARAYFEQLGTAQAKPAAAEAKAYYETHPALFSERRVFTLQELAIPDRADLLPEVRQQVADARSMAALEAWLKANGVKFAASTGVRAAEQIPLEILPAIHAVKDGNMLVRDDAGAIKVIQVVSSQSKPVDLATALPAIQQFLANSNAAERAKQEMARLRAEAKIEYLGDFANATQPAVATQAAAATPSAAAPPERASPIEPAGTPPAINLEKGAAGLK